MSYVIHNGDCREVMSQLADASIDAIVTDPPYGLGFMGKAWDHGVPGIEFWQEMLRVAKPGAYLLAFGGSRTSHRMATAIEDAGWEIRDTIMWLYGSGFPKSHNLGDGRGTALKPAHEPIIMARKPLVGTVAANVLAYGTGALNIDFCRVPATDNVRFERAPGGVSRENWRKGTCVGPAIPIELGRWPANVIHDGSEEVLAAFPDAPGQQRASRDDQRKQGVCFGAITSNGGRIHKPRKEADTSAARFFYCAKASKADREEGNTHPTVKPTELMRYLCRLVTPKGGVILDPFCGSGSTGKAAVLEWCNFIGIDMEAEYVAIAEARIAASAAKVPA